VNLVGQHRFKSPGIANLIDTPERRQRPVDVAWAKVSVIFRATPSSCAKLKTHGGKFLRNAGGSSRQDFCKASTYSVNTLRVIWRIEQN
jgi:hypothetical protein